MKKLRGEGDIDQLARYLIYVHAIHPEGYSMSHQCLVRFRKLASILSLNESLVSMKEAAQLDYFVAGY